MGERSTTRDILASPASAAADTGALLRELSAAYDGACAISGCRVSEVLQVVLIQPDGELKPANALLLRADLALLFGAGLLSVEAVSLAIVVAPHLAEALYAGLHGQRLRQPARLTLSPSRQLLDRHYRRFAQRFGLPPRSTGPLEAPPSTDNAPARSRRRSAALHERAVAQTSNVAPHDLSTSPSSLAPAHSAVPTMSVPPPVPAPAPVGKPTTSRIIHVRSLVNSVCFSPDGTLLATGSWDGAARLWRVADGTLLHTLTGDLGEVNSVCFSPDGRILAAAGRETSVRLWRVADAAPLFALRDGHQGPVFSVGFSPDGTTVATGSWDRSALLWRSSDGESAGMLREHRGAVNSVAFSPKGRLLATGSHDRSVRIWRLGGAEPAHVLQGHTDAVFSVCFSPDGKLLASAGTDQTIRMWRAADASLLYTLPAQRGAIFALAFSPDGQTLVSGDYGRAVRLWRVGDGALLHAVGGHGEGVTSVAFSPDGARLASGSFDATVRIWELRG